MIKLLMGIVCVSIAIVGVALVVSRDRPQGDLQIAAPSDSSNKGGKDDKEGSGALRPSLGF